MKSDKELALINSLKSPSDVSDFFADLEFSTVSLRLVVSLAESVKEHESLYLMHSFAWMSKHAEALEDKEASSLAVELISHALFAYKFKDTWISIHTQLAHLLLEAPSSLLLAVLENKYISIITLWMFEPQLVHYLLWVWQKHISSVPLETSLHFLRVALMPQTSLNKLRVFGGGPDITPAFKTAEHSFWNDLSEAYGHGRTAIIPFLLMHSVEETFAIIRQSLEVTLYLEVIGSQHSPPKSYSSYSRNSIEDSSQTNDSPTKYSGYLLILLRDALTHLKAQNPPLWVQTVRSLGMGQWYALHRIAMNALSEDEGRESLKLIMELLPAWIQSLTAEASSSYTECMHELWMLLSQRSAMLIKSRRGQGLLLNVLAELDAFYEKRARANETEDLEDSSMSRSYHGMRMRVWLWAVSGALHHPLMSEYRSRYDHYRSLPDEYGENHEKDTFTHYMTSGPVSELSSISLEEFFAKFKSEGLDAVVSLIIQTPTSRARSQEADGAIVRYSLSPLMKELACTQIQLVKKMLEHPDMLRVDQDYLSSISYGLNDLTRKLREAKRGVGRNGPTLFLALSRALEIRRKLLKRAEYRSGDYLHGTYMAIYDLSFVVSSSTQRQSLVLLIGAAIGPEMFPDREATEENRTLRERGYEFMTEEQYVLLALSNVMHATFQNKGTKAHQSVAKAVCSTIDQIMRQCQHHKRDFEIARFIGSDLHLWLAYTRRYEPKLHLDLLQFFQRSFIEKESDFGTGLRYGYLEKGRAFLESPQPFIEFYENCITECGTLESNGTYSRLLAWHLFMMYVHSRGGLQGKSHSTNCSADYTQAIERLLQRALSHPNPEYDALRKGLIAAPGQIPNSIDRVAWSHTVIPYYKMLLECTPALGGVHGSLVSWVYSIPDDISLSEGDQERFYPWAIVLKGILSTTFDSVDDGRFELLFEKLKTMAESRPNELLEVCKLTREALTQIVKLHGVNSDIGFRYWHLQKAWEIVGVAESLPNIGSHELEHQLGEIRDLLADLGVRPLR